MARGKGRRRSEAEIKTDARRNLTGAEARRFSRRVEVEGGASVVKEGLGEMPLLLWLVVAAIILYLYLRRASLGIDTHPGEKVVSVQPPARPSVTLGPPLPEGGPVTLGKMPVYNAPFVTLSPSGGGGGVN